MNTKFKQDFFERIKKNFIDESTDIIQQLEKDAALLEEHENDGQMVEPILADIFRMIHSMKASNATMGHNNMADLLHLGESFLEKIVNKEVTLDKTTWKKVILLVDTVIEGMQEVLQSNQDIAENRAAEHLNVIKESSSRSSDGSEELKTKIWCIHFRPGSNILKQGNDPAIYLKELSSIGEIIQLNPNTTSVPGLSDLVFDRIYLSWEIILKTSHSEPQIKDIFKFIAGDIQIEIREEDDPQKLVKKSIDDEIEVGQILIERGKISESDIQNALIEQNKISDIFIKNKLEKETKTDLLNEKEDEKKELAVTLPTTVRVDINKLDRLMNLVGELVINESHIRNIVKEVPQKELQRQLAERCDEISRTINYLQDQVMNVRMVPVEMLFSQFHRTVRELTSKQNKKAHLILSGQETELDKNIIEKLNNPLKHLIRNAIDHGIERPEERIKMQKDPEAKIFLNAFQKEGAVFIEIKDDGRGLNKERIYQKALEKGFISADDPIDEHQLYEFIFQPGFSTAEQVTDISGRGVGMDVVKKTIQELRGKIEIFTQRGQGTTFLIRLPLTLAIIEGLIFRLNQQVFVIPLLIVDETFGLHTHQIMTMEEKGEFVDVRGHPTPLIRLGKLLGMNSKSIRGPVLNVTINRKQYSLMVDEIIGQQQVVLKGLEKNFRKVPGFSGATILGNGQIAPIIDPEEIIKCYLSE